MFSAHHIEQRAAEHGATVRRVEGGRTIEVEFPSGRFEVWMSGPGGFQLVHSRQLERAESAAQAAA